MAAASPSVHCYPVDSRYEKPEVLEAAAHVYYTKLLEESSSEPEILCIPGREKIKLETSLMRFLPLYREDSKCMLLVLTDPQDKNKVLAVYFHNSWWLIEDVVKTADPSRDGLMQVQTYTERIVLFVLNCIIFGMLERDLTCDVLFVPHSKEECAKIFWKRGEAAAFYTVKAKGGVPEDYLAFCRAAGEEACVPFSCLWLKERHKTDGSLCDGNTSQCYLLPVLDTIFVQKKFRRCGLGMEMLRNFCQMFATEDALGLSCPISAGMYRVCQKFLETHLEEQSRLWEVEAPGDWSQRVNIWLTIHLEENLPKSELTSFMSVDCKHESKTEETDSSCHIKKFQDDESGQSDEEKMNQRSHHLPNRNMSMVEVKEFKQGPEEAGFHLEEHDIQPASKMQQYLRANKRQISGELFEAPKHFKAMP